MAKPIDKEEIVHDVLMAYNRKCKCGHTVYVPRFKDKQLCTWCGSYVFKTPKDEFIYRLNEARNKQKQICQ